ncbi:MAG TPA: BadF/BadG/BcrA/BcrD ATPase family protein [Streptosporangiaceae bacterium]|nr:BadF/BadG/BcrA/BcrD ATPase family protein [Streptosporangiaceae bacterium]
MSTDPAAVIAVDAGNSKTDLALVARDGRLLASVRGAGMPGDTALADKMELLADLVSQAQRQAGLSGSPVAEHICACVANVDLPEEEEEFVAAVEKHAWSNSLAVVNDTFAVLRAGYAPGGATPPGAGEPYWGVAVTCGAGINCVGVAPDGRTTRFLAIGYISGDWGGGSGIGRAAQWWAIRDEDGRGPRTALREAVAAHFGLPTVYDVAVALHQHRISEDSLLDLAPVVMSLAAEGDQVAARIVQRQAEEVVAMALAAMRRLGIADLATPVILGGGLLTARDPLLEAGITAGLAAGAPDAVAHVVGVPPIAGAALLGLDHLGVGLAAQQQLCAAYAPPSG